MVEIGKGILAGSAASKGVKDAERTDCDIAEAAEDDGLG